jgi:hypothetical protein
MIRWMKSHAGLRVATLLAAITLFAPAVVRAQGDAVAIARAKVDRVSAVRQALRTAENASGVRRVDALNRLATQLDRDAVRAGDAAKVRTLATAVKEVATTSR